MNLVNSTFLLGKVPEHLLPTFISLIMEKEILENVGDFRLITLLNVSLKIISKVFVNCMWPIMQRIIGLHQNSFLLGRSTLDNIILTQDVLHNMNNKIGKKGLMVIKLDLHKAYDSVD